HLVGRAPRHMAVVISRAKVFGTIEPFPPGVRPDIHRIGRHLVVAACHQGGSRLAYWWPSRSSFFGIVDLAGIPKDIYYMYQSEWTDTPVLHLFPHWNWKKGETVDVWAYYNQADEVE